MKNVAKKLYPVWTKYNVKFVGIWAIQLHAVLESYSKKKFVIKPGRNLKCQILITGLRQKWIQTHSYCNKELHLKDYWSKEQMILEKRLTINLHILLIILSQILIKKCIKHFCWTCHQLLHQSVSLFIKAFSSQYNEFYHLVNYSCILWKEISGKKSKWLDVLKVWKQLVASILTLKHKKQKDCGYQTLSMHKQYSKEQNCLNCTYSN